MKARSKSPSQQVRTPVSSKDFEDLGAGLNLDRCTMVGGLFWTTLSLYLELHRGVCCRDIRDVSLVPWDRRRWMFVRRFSTIRPC